MTFIGFLLGLAVGAGMMFYLAGSRVRQQQQGGQQGQQGQQQNRRGMSGTPGFNTEFGAMDDASTDPNNTVKPAALSAAVFAREGSSAQLTDQGNKQSAGQLPTDSTALETGVSDQPRTDASTMTEYNNDTNPDPALGHAAVASRIEPGNGSSANKAANGTSKAKQKNGKNKR